MTTTGRSNWPVRIVLIVGLILFGFEGRLIHLLGQRVGLW